MPSAQVLLTFFDMSARTHYLNARHTLQTLLRWRVLPVINENDTTTTDEISFGDNDFLAAQVAILIGADRLVLLTDTGGLYSADPRRDPDARLRGGGARLEELEGYEIGLSSSPLGSGGMRSKVGPPRWPRPRASRSRSRAGWTRERWRPLWPARRAARASIRRRAACRASSCG